MDCFAVHWLWVCGRKGQTFVEVPTCGRVWWCTIMNVCISSVCCSNAPTDVPPLTQLGADLQPHTADLSCLVAMIVLQGGGNFARGQFRRG